MKVKRSTQFEKTMSLGVNVIRVINDIQPFSDDGLSQVGRERGVYVACDRMERERFFLLFFFPHVSWAAAASQPGYHVFPFDSDYV